MVYEDLWVQCLIDSNFYLHFQIDELMKLPLIYIFDMVVK